MDIDIKPVDIDLFDIKDVKVIVQIGEYNFSIVRKEDVDEKEAKEVRKALLTVLQRTHDILAIPLEKIENEKIRTKFDTKI